MKIHTVSDLHLEFYTPMTRPAVEFTHGSADVLILAGDILVAKHLNEKRTDKKSRAHRKIYHKFLRNACESYKQVLYVPGNHEYYGSSLVEASVDLKELETRYPNLHILDNNTFEYDDVVFHGCTMWTDYDHGNPLSMLAAQQGMNDYCRIRLTVKGKQVTPQNLLSLHTFSKYWLNDSLRKHYNAKNVVITHHAPLYYSNEQKPTKLYGCFYSELDSIYCYNDIKLWAFGHTHDPYDSIDCDTQFVTNPSGYASSNKQPKAVLLKSFVV